MPDGKLVMGYWDCSYCGHKGIKGTVRECPSCGKPRGNDTKFYMKAHNHSEVVSRGDYLTDSEAASKGQGADWQCAYCGGLNSALDAKCSSCGHGRDDADADYFQMREASEQRQAAQQAEYDALSGALANSIKTMAFYQQKWFKIIIVLAVIAAFIAFVCAPRTAEFSVSSKSWEYSTVVEEYKYVDEDDWSLPEGADLIRKANEIHHYNQVLDHYETRERTYQERVPDGSHTEYSYHDNGDGTFTEVAHEVTDYTYETRTETYREPIYRQEPVYQVKYYYKIWRWKYKTTVVNAGEDDEDPHFADVKLGEKERIGDQTKKFTLHGKTDKSDAEQSFEVDEDTYNEVRSGDRLKVSVNIKGDVKGLAKDK